MFPRLVWQECWLGNRFGTGLHPLPVFVASLSKGLDFRVVFNERWSVCVRVVKKPFCQYGSEECCVTILSRITAYNGACVRAWLFVIVSFPGKGNAFLVYLFSLVVDRLVFHNTHTNTHTLSPLFIQATPAPSLTIICKCTLYLSDQVQFH